MRSLPWSTRAVILVAFAIQFGSVGAGIAASVAATPAGLRLCDGTLLPMLWADTASRAGAASSPPPVVMGRAGDVAATQTSTHDRVTLSVEELVSPAQLPIPPPLAA